MRKPHAKSLQNKFDHGKIDFGKKVKEGKSG